MDPTNIGEDAERTLSTSLKREYNNNNEINSNNNN